jgi:hypothetical protein
LKRKRQKIAKDKQKITTQDLLVGNVINAIIKEKANGAACKKLANRLQLNENGNTKVEPDYSGRKGAPRFIKPHMATDDWQIIVSKKKTTKNRTTNYYFKCFLPGHYKRQCKNNIKRFKCGRSGHTKYKCKEKDHNASKETNTNFDQTKRTQNNPSQMPGWQNSLFWKSMAKIKFSFNCSIKFRVGNGKKTLFWEDCWLECPIKQLYPTLYNQSKQRDCTVEEVYRQGQWQLLFHADSIEIQQ